MMQGDLIAIRPQRLVWNMAFQSVSVFKQKKAPRVA
jgi:hypothetical protein